MTTKSNTDSSTFHHLASLSTGECRNEPSQSAKNASHIQSGKPDIYLPLSNSEAVVHSIPPILFALLMHTRLVT